MNIIRSEIIEFKEQPCPYCERSDAGCMGYCDGSGGLCFGEGFRCEECGEIVPMPYGINQETIRAWCQFYHQTPEREDAKSYRNRQPTRQEKLRARAGRRKLLNQAAEHSEPANKDADHDH